MAKYDLRIGFGKVFQHAVIWLAPAFLAGLAALPVELGPLASACIELLRNYIKTNSKG